MERNLREAFYKFKEASRNSHSSATRELAECYLHGRGCERNLVKVVKIGSSKAALELGLKMEKEEKSVIKRSIYDGIRFGRGRDNYSLG